MEVNNVSFGSKFQFNPKQLQRVSKVAQKRVTLALKQYAGVGDRQINSLFSGDSLTLSVNDANDKFITGFFKTVGVTPNKM